MKLPTPEKLPSGQWNIRVMVDGRRVSITRDSERECIAEAAAIKAGHKAAHGPSKTLSSAIDNYIASRENVLSPSTVAGYKRIQRTRFQSSMGRKLSDLNEQYWQRAVNSESKLCSAKTLKNSWCFIASVIRDQDNRDVKVRLPQVVHEDGAFLSAEQIPEFLYAIRGTPHEIPILLGLSSLRRSEIFAIRYRDIDIKAGCIHVHGSAVLDIDNKLVQRKENKNTTSRRTVPFVLPQLEEAVLRSDHDPDALVATCTPNHLYKAVNAACKRAGLPLIGAHGLRRSFASLCYHLGLSEEFCMQAGGWSDIYTMRKIYTQLSEADRKSESDKLKAFFRQG